MKQKGCLRASRRIIVGQVPKMNIITLLKNRYSFDILVVFVNCRHVDAGKTDYTKNHWQNVIIAKVCLAGE